MSGRGSTDGNARTGAALNSASSSFVEKMPLGVATEIGWAARKSELFRVILLHLLDALVRAEKRVLGHIGRILARRRPLAYGFG